MHVLHSAGYAPDLVSTESAAMQRLTERWYDLVVADCRLSDGDGLIVVDRAADLGMKTAILTGYAFPMPAEARERYMRFC